jgi:hypothetical protein
MPRPADEFWDRVSAGGTEANLNKDTCWKLVEHRERL